MSHNEKTLSQKYDDYRNKYYTPDISRHMILVNTMNHSEHAASIKNYEFIVDFSDEGYGRFTNVIGFRLIKAGVPNRDYQITDNNKRLSFTFGGVSKEISLYPGSYTGDTMATALTAKINSVLGVSGVSVTFNDITLKFTFGSSSSDIGLNFASSVKNLHIILGFDHDDITASSSITSTNIPDFSIHYVDIVVDEIPYIACKKNKGGKHTIERIGLHSPIGTMNYYENKYLDYQNFFPPVILSKLSVQVLDDHGDHYNSGEIDMFFEFEVTVLNHPF